MTGIIDIGSNTLRLVLYEKNKKIKNIAVGSEILSDTKDAILSHEGIEKLCKTITYFCEKSEGARIFAFATYALRTLENKEEVKRIVFEETGVKIDILSGEDEAKYDFYGLLGSISKKEEGIGVDLGGGSAQIFVFKNEEIRFCYSYPIGCKRLKNQFVQGKFPTQSEEGKLREYIKEKLLSLVGTCQKKIFMMGGTAKTAIKLYSYLKGTENRDTLDVENLYEIIRFIKETPEEAMKNILKYRYDNIVVGIIIMEEIAKIVGADKIHIKKCGVRDGYLLKKEEN